MGTDQIHASFTLAQFGVTLHVSYFSLPSKCCHGFSTSFCFLNAQKLSQEQLIQICTWSDKVKIQQIHENAC